MALQFVELRLYNAAGTTYEIMPDFHQVEFDVKYNDLGAISIVYPKAAAKTAGLGDGSLVGIVASDGTTVKEVERYLLQGTGSDLVVDEVPMIQLTGNDTKKILDDAVIYPSNWPVASPPGHEFADKSIGNIWRTLIQRAQDRGCFTMVDESGFDGLVDVSGAGWNASLTMNFGTGERYLAILQDQMNRGLVDAWMEGWALKMRNGGTRGTHIPIGTLELRAASNVTDINVTTDSSESATAVLIEGADGVALERTSAPALTLLGRRRERSVNQSGINDVGTLTILADAELALYGRIPTEETVGVASSITPFFTFDVADWVWVRIDGAEVPVERRVWQVAVSVDANRDTTVGLTLNTILYEDDVKLQRKVDAYTGSSGTYGGVASNTDWSIPADVASLTPTSTYVLDPHGQYIGVVLLTHPVVNTNQGGSDATDIEGYEYQWQYTGETEWTSVSSATSPGRISPVIPGSHINVRVRAFDSSGNRSTNWRTVSDYTVAIDTTPPPTPSAPDLSLASFGIIVEWDGLTSTGANQPLDFAHVEVWHSPNNNFTPGDAGSVMAGYMFEGGSRFISGEDFDVATYVKLVAVDVANNRSVAASAQDSIIKNTEGSDGLVPASSPAAVVTPWVSGAIEVTWTPIANDSEVTYEIYADTNSGVTTADEKVGEVVGDNNVPRFRFSKLGGNPLPYQPIYVRIRARDVDGVATTLGTEGSATPRQITYADVIAEFASFLQLEAEQINFSTLSGEIGLLGELLVGGYIRIDGGDSTITIYGDLAHTDPLIRLRPPAMGGSTFHGEVFADSLDVIAQLTLGADASMEVSAGASITLMTGAGDPMLAPSLDDVTINALPAWPAPPTNYVSRGINWDAVDGCWIRLVVPGANQGSVSGKCRVERINATTGALIGYRTLSDIASIGEDDMNSIARVGGFYYSAVFRRTTGQWRTHSWDATVGPAPYDGAHGAERGDDEGRAAVCPLGNGTVGLCYVDSGIMRLRNSSDALIADDTDIDWSGKSDDIMYAEYNSSDWGVSNVLVIGAGANVRTWRNTGAAGFWPTYSTLPEVSLGSSVYMGGVVRKPTDGHFYSSVSGGPLQKHSKYAPAVGELAYVSYQNRDNSAHHTKSSPIASKAVAPGRYLQVGPLPPLSTLFTDSDVHAILATTTPALSGLKKQTTTSLATVRTASIDPTVINAGGVAPTNTNNFLAGASSQLLTSSGGFILNGDGTGAWPLLTSLPGLTTANALTSATALASLPALTSAPALRSIYDTGWQTLSYAVGTNGQGQLSWRMYGKIVYIRGAVDRNTTEFGTTSTTVATLPQTFGGFNIWPGNNERYASFGTGGRIGRVEITDLGEIKVAVPNQTYNQMGTTSGPSSGTSHTHDLDEDPPEQPFTWLGLSHTYMPS